MSLQTSEATHYVLQSFLGYLRAYRSAGPQVICWPKLVMKPECCIVFSATHTTTTTSLTLELIFPSKERYSKLYWKWQIKNDSTLAIYLSREAWLCRGPSTQSLIRRCMDPRRHEPHRLGQPRMWPRVHNSCFIIAKVRASLYQSLLRSLGQARVPPQIQPWLLLRLWARPEA